MSCYWRTYRGEVPVTTISEGLVSIREFTYSVERYMDKQSILKAWSLVAPLERQLNETCCSIKLCTRRGKPAVDIHSKVDIRLTRLDNNKVEVIVNRMFVILLRYDYRELFRATLDIAQLDVILKYLKL